MSDWHSKALELSTQGYSGRKIANMLGRSKSQVNHIINTMKAVPVVQIDDESEYDKDLDTLANNPDFSVSNLAKRLRSAQKANTQLRRVQRELFDSEVDTEVFFTQLQEVIDGFSYQPFAYGSVIANIAPSKGVGTVEILFSDMQIGKLCADYNTDVARERMKKFSSGVLEIIENSQYKIERIILASLGDIVEDNMKHGVGSAAACDTGLAEQMADAIGLIWQELIVPLASINVRTDVMCIAGNHGSSQHKGMDVFKAGRSSYDYPIYRALQMLSEAAGLTNVNFIIPEGVFGYLNVYGNYVIYEHGYFNQATEKGMNDQMKKRGQQIKKHVEYYRQGDKHNVQAFDCGKIVLNGAFFGNDSNATEYAGVLGFSAIPAQVVMVHSPDEKVGRNTVKEFHTIQLA
ncbi:metallo-dependent phosphatase [Rheinheimera phage Barba5S]|uniref:Metallo-dependent phosphatase n=2 Tax=Barbavirus TaxID=2733095 RepID=A0A4P8N2J2_9CAUD|nr:metallo-dependent phosphatase [Rheinheimera phage Barba5S]QCQ59088.1 metallo-dependent phosphatase [Rheinheimera phage Barba5S]QCQ60054.1 metallo-dependent phosphatase [Rheinheimera phage vB_RspM_Barba10S]